jgi:hypothetical protein
VNERASLFPAALYALHYRLVTDGTDVQFTATQDGATDGYAVSVAAATTAAVPVTGRVRYYAWVVATADATDRTTVDEGWVTLLPDPATVTATASQTHAEKMVALLEAELESRAASGLSIQGYTVAGRSLQYYSHDEIRKLLGQYRAEMNRERNGGRSLTPIYAGFGQPGYPGAGAFGQRNPYGGSR